MDARALVTLFLEKKFHNRPGIVDETFKLIYDYNKDRKKANYEKTLKIICSLMGTEIPNKVLIYLLTLLDMPVDISESDEFIEKMKALEQIYKSCLDVPYVEPEESVKPELEETFKPKLDETLKPELKSSASESGPSTSVVAKKPEKEKFLKPRSRRRNKMAEPSKPAKPRMETLQHLTASLVVRDHRQLKRIYQEKFDKAWKLVNSNQCSGEPLQQCFRTLEDLNRKRKLLREIENDNITEGTIRDFYMDVDVVLKAKHVYDFVHFDYDKL